MFGISLFEIAVLVGVCFLVFGGKRAKDSVDDITEGFRAFRRNLRSTPEAPKPPPPLRITDSRAE